ncbi:MAG: YggT family protein [Deltaproteobacteria bacterium]|nr:MAG: YggT family protein [Deltaproteobacteria bacterium]
MYLFKGIIDIVILVLLLRLLIRPREAFFDPIYGLIYRITNPLLIPAGYMTRNTSYGTILTILALVVLRGGVYVSLQPMSFLSGIGVSFLSLVQLLFQGYMVMWVVSLFSERSFGTSFLLLIDRAFSPLRVTLRRLGIQSHKFHLSVFLFLMILYSLLSTIIRFAIIPKAVLSAVSLVYGIGEGLMLFVGLFPGFFSIVIIIGALLSWVSPDPSNPVVQAIYGISEPLLTPFRRFVPLLGGLDITPIIAILTFQLLGRLAQQIIARFIGMV